MKKLRTTFIIAVIAIVFSLQINAQSTDSVSNDFYSYTNKMDAYYDNLIESTPDTVKIPD